MEGYGRFNVIVRLRPTLASEVEGKHLFEEDKEECVFISPSNKEVTLTKRNYEDRSFIYDQVIAPSIDQVTTYKYSGESIVNEVLKGYNATIMAYGQTGSGKTYTIFGPKNTLEFNYGRVLNSECGIVFRSLNHIFQHIEEKQDLIQFQVTCSLIQIYMENINDLLDETKAKESLQIREDPELGVFVGGVTQKSVSSVTEVLNLIKKGVKQRITQATTMNKTSSRSHVLIQILVEQRWIETVLEEESQNSPYSKNKTMSPKTKAVKKKHIKKGLLTIVDLAGSERLSKSNSEGLRIEEAKNINKSISALGNCIAALATDKSRKSILVPQNHIPYRDSKLTRLLTDSLGGNSKTSVIACISPTLANYDETFSTLLFASRAMNIKTLTKVNEDIQVKAELLRGQDVSPNRETMKLREELEMVKQQLNNHYFNQTISSMSTNAKSNMNSAMLSREDSGQFSLSNLKGTFVDEKMRITRKESEDRFTKNERNKSEDRTEKYVKPFLLNLNTAEAEAQQSKREQELIKRYSGVIDNLQQQVSKKNQKIASLEEKLNRYAQMYGEFPN
jgi:hypothetical protein